MKCWDAMRSAKRSRDLLEGITLHALESKAPFSKETLAHVGRFKTVYGLSLTAKDSHRLVERRDEKR